MSSLKLYQNAARSAEMAGLRYVSDDQPGIRRQRWGRGFSYIDVDGTRIQDRQRKEKFKAMAIPPSWEEVWICCDENGHLQATGRDLKARKQYRYHPAWIALRKQIKFDRLIPFALALPALRKKVQRTISVATAAIESGEQESEILDRETVIAAVVKLLDDSFMRVGNQQYAQANQSHGLTTLKDRHADISSGRIELEFVGKSGVERDVTVQNAQLAEIVKRCEEIPGQTLFQYFDEEGDRQSIESGDVNDYLRAAMGDRFTAKDFRTWGGTVTAAQTLYKMGLNQSAEVGEKDIDRDDIDRHIIDAVKIAAQRLGNRPATCRKYYIHPSILAAYREGRMAAAIAQHDITDPTLLKFLDEAERQTLSLLQGQQQPGVR